MGKHRRKKYTRSGIQNFKKDQKKEKNKIKPKGLNGEVHRGGDQAGQGEKRERQLEVKGEKES